MKHKTFSLINVSGLAIGISAALVIYMIVYYEFSFDTFHKDGDRIYRATTVMHFPDQEFKNSGVPVPLCVALKNEVTGVESVAPFFIVPGQTVVDIPRDNNKSEQFKKQTDIILADENYFNLFNYEFKAGNSAELKRPFTVVLTESRSKVYFPERDFAQVLGRTVIYNDSVKATVVGIVKDISESTDLNFKEFISYSTIEQSHFKDFMDWDKWGSVNSNVQLWMKLGKQIAPAQIEKQIAAITTKHAKDSYLKMDHSLQSLASLHFNPEYDNFGQRQAHKSTLYGLLILAAFLLLLGCINFINLTTAQSAQRAKEIGIRKTMGSNKKQLLFQFLNETFILTIIAALFAIALIPLALKIFVDFIPSGITMEMIRQPHVIVFIVGLIIIVSLLSGFYPSIILTRYNPSLVLKNQSFGNGSKTRSSWLRKTLTVSQFVIAQFFIIATMIVGKQIQYSLHKDLGFKKEAIINFEVPSYDNRRFVLKDKLAQIPGIELVSLGGSAPASQAMSIQTMKFHQGDKEIETTVEAKYADTNYFKVYQMKLLAGSYLKLIDTSHTITDQTVKEYVINNSLAKFLGFTNPADAIGKFLERGSSKVPITGVLADFHSKSLHEQIKPLAFAFVNNNQFTFHVAMKASQEKQSTWPATIASIEKEYKLLYPGEEAFKYEFFDESIAKFYQAEQNTSKLLSWTTGIAIFISCLGLLGLAIYTTNLRKKEIGVRKVLGASVTQIVSLLCANFIWLVLFGFLIAAPLAGWAMQHWLENFAYRTTISWSIFILSGTMLLFVALATLSVQIFRAANANPVKSLRTE